MSSDKNRNCIFVSLILVVLALTCSCSVKEDRRWCPCHLLLDFSCQHDTLPRKLPDKNLFAMHIAQKYGTYSFSDMMNLNYSCTPSGYELSVPRNYYYVNAVISNYPGFVLDKGYLIKEGQECPEAYMGIALVNANCDFSRTRVILHKNFCRISVLLSPMPKRLSLGMSLTGNVCGYSMDGSLVEGAFDYRLDIDNFGNGNACIPRQKDNSLLLNILSGNKILRSFALGEFIAETGYDWSAEDLKDIAVRVDYSDTSLNFRIDKWSRTVSFELVI
jgi:hypothetical protein